LLNAYCQAKYRILATRSVVADAGLYVYDVLNEEEIFLMDLAFSRSLTTGGVALATRTVPLGDYWMTSGAALPITSTEDVKAAFQPNQHGNGARDARRSGRVAAVNCARLLKAGAAEYVEYAGPEARPKARPRMPRWPGSKRHRRPI
jgi:hypothetical protein